MFVRVTCNRIEFCPSPKNKKTKSIHHFDRMQWHPSEKKKYDTNSCWTKTIASLRIGKNKQKTSCSSSLLPTTTRHTFDKSRQ